MSLRILIIDDDPKIAESLSDFLGEMGHQTQACGDGESGLQIATEEHFDLIFLDVRLPRMDGLQVLEQLKRLRPDQRVIMISGHGELEIAVKATKLGADNFLEKPLHPDKLLLEVKNVERQQSLLNEMATLRKLVDFDYEMVGNSPAMQRLRQEIDRAAPTESRILIYGENGSGKELVARAIHQKSHRHHKPFIKVNCAAIPKELIESELFGYEKGAFTGASKRKNGLIEEADGGTLLLDEVGDLSPESQAKLLRVLQENEFVRVGGTQPVRFDVRIISATNKDLQQQMQQGSFREDLFFRLNVIPIRVPALRERREDIPILVRHFINLYCMKNGKRPIQVSEAALQPLMHYQWRGNVRELKNFIERLLIMSDREEIGLEDVLRFLPEDFARQFAALPSFDGTGKDQRSLRDQLAWYERQLLQREFIAAQGNVSLMARRLHTDRPNLIRKLKKLGIK
ncbi:MAG: sigma-54 dependent transcriptional regulator [candidate division KSB1 bacterium]|nr:sigma-54 dependent transcriptional regulator [candidate division KSB1 bacterium]MDZ7334619.1 sigma-54 dependent transcriptional regulator [candidate division KSB1 bacterium]MDZ7356573.1 sigma-54 dependent transcriptional regulator [candidate division KSB1 bacterium]MDZ7399890.1 sigma-54 dependent transcriptional regulator [candidate division KSB1 bacterium]